MNRRMLLSSAGATLALLCLAACETTPPPPPPAPPPAPVAVEQRGSEVVAIVETVDRTKREVLLRLANRSLLTVHVPESVQNLAQIRSGDRLTVRYDRALIAAVAQPGQAAPTPEAVLAAERAAAGQRLGGAVGAIVRAQVTIRSVDTANNIVVFTGPRGVLRAAEVRDPQLQEFIRTLRPGERVNLLLAEAVALSVQKMQR